MHESDDMKTNRGCQDLVFQLRLLYQDLKKTHQFHFQSHDKYISTQATISEIDVYRAPVIAKPAPTLTVKKAVRFNIFFILGLDPKVLVLFRSASLLSSPRLPSGSQPTTRSQRSSSPRRLPRPHSPTRYVCLLPQLWSRSCWPHPNLGSRFATIS